MWLNWVLCLKFHKVTVNGCSLIRGPPEEGSASRITHVVGKIHFLVVGLRAPFLKKKF